MVQALSIESHRPPHYAESFCAPSPASTPAPLTTPHSAPPLDSLGPHWDNSWLCLTCICPFMNFLYDLQAMSICFEPMRSLLYQIVSTGIETGKCFCYQTFNSQRLSHHYQGSGHPALPPFKAQQTLVCPCSHNSPLHC